MIKKVVISFLLFAVTAFYANAIDRHAPGKGYQNGRGHYSHGNGHGYGHSKPIVGAPLDGGLLLVLGGAGVAYLAARKKKENS
jgi:hypothetical protein